MTSLKEAGEVASNGKNAYHHNESYPRKKMMSVEVHFLDNTTSTFHIQFKAPGRVLFEEVCKMLNLLEVDYFGLEYTDDRGTKHWLDYEKLMCRQTGLSSSCPTMYFLVKFFTPDPAQLEEEYTRYLYGLQIKKDLAQGLLQCNDNTAALMASYIVQAECGDYAAEDYPDHTYLSCYKFVPHQDAELQDKIMENHKKHIGQSPAEADLNLLETARRCELYGIRMIPAKDHEGVPLNLAVAHMGILVFQNYTKINTFSWAKIRKLSFKRKRFLIKLHPEGYGYYKDTVEFFFDHRNESKNFWKKCIENHAFFRCAEVKKPPRQRPRIFSRGSSFRYSGRTQKQVVEFVRENYVQRRTFQRSVSLRVSGMKENGSGTVVNCDSDLPLIPVTTSQSCGSVALLPNSTDTNISENKPLSHSEPPSPFSIPDCEQGNTNGSCQKDNSEDQIEDQSPQHDSPEADDTDGLRSPDYLGQDTDDNISHDSYHLEEKEAFTSESNDHSSSDDLISKNALGETNKILLMTPLENGVLKEADNSIIVGPLKAESNDILEELSSKTSAGKVSDGDIQYVLHRRKIDNETQKDRSPSLERSRIRVEIDHPLVGQVSPNLYARANRLNINSTSDAGGNSPGPSQTVDFVHVNHLPSVGSFSSHDDSIEESSLEKEIFEQLRKKKFFEMDEISILEEKSIEERSSSKDDDDYLPSETDTVVENITKDKSANESSKKDDMHNTSGTVVQSISAKEIEQKTVNNQTALNSILDRSMNSSVSKEENVLNINNKDFVCEGNKNGSLLQETLLVRNENDLVEDSVETKKNHIEAVFLEINQDAEDTVSPHSHYTYSCYKFSQECSSEECISNDI